MFRTMIESDVESRRQKSSLLDNNLKKKHFITLLKNIY